MQEEKKYIWKDKKRWLFFGLPWTFTHYLLTEEKLIIKKGFFTITNEEIRLYRMQDLLLKQTLFQRIFNLGTVYIMSTDKTNKDIELKNIKNAENIKELFSDLIEKERDNKRVFGREIYMDNGGEDFDFEQ